MEVLATYSNYKDFKQALDREMYGAVESFVKIGYLLKFAEETNIVNEGGYATVNEFAKRNTGLMPHRYPDLLISIRGLVSRENQDYRNSTKIMVWQNWESC